MLKGKKVLLRPMQKKDVESFFKWRNDIEIKNLSLMHPFPVTLEADYEWYERISKSKDNNTIFFSIEDIESKDTVGFIKLFNINWIHKYCYFGIVIGEKSVQGKGIGTEATKLIVDYAFNTLNLNKIILEVVDFNLKAINLYKKNGFVEEGRLKKNVYIKDKWHDVLIMSLFRK